MCHSYVPPLHTQATCVVTGGVLSRALCAQDSAPLCLDIISLHLKQSTHTALAHSPVNTCKPVKGPHCHSPCYKGGHGHGQQHFKRIQLGEKV